MNLKKKYCNSIINYSRLKTNQVMVGNVGIGGDNPIRIQSMTTTDTMDTDASVNQSIAMIEKGCELVRLTAPSIKDARNLFEIKNRLIQKGHKVPLIADIHFTPNAAIEAAKIVEKVRINPGNFSDKKKFQTTSYTHNQYKEELQRIEEKFNPLIETCKNYNTAMRIGTNHGSLSDRIMSHYGDTPLGMVESALEFVRICEKQDFKRIILSMKASNPIIMIQAYRLLVNKMQQEDMYYPIHLGVTEAGEGDDGRIKSAIGIGSLLMDGIGDTIRVSLTEEPEAEILPAKNIVKYIGHKKIHQKMIDEVDINKLHPFSYFKRKTYGVMNIGAANPPVVIFNMSRKKNVSQKSLFSLGYHYSVKLDKWNINDVACDYIFMGNQDFDFNPPGNLRVIYNYKTWLTHKKGYPVMTAGEYVKNTLFSQNLNIVKVSIKDLTEKFIKKINSDLTVVLLLKVDNVNFLGSARLFFTKLISANVLAPVFLERNYDNFNEEEIIINSSIDLGAVLLDGLGDGVFFSSKKLSNFDATKLAFNILQATRTRISKTEYISCPSCGRTLFDLEETTAKIRNATSHLKGLKIGVMGCIVNGPGEMADADYGYVGTGPQKISLYKQKTLVKRNVPTKDALNELIQLIKDNGDWFEPIYH